MSMAGDRVCVHPLGYFREQVCGLGGPSGARDTCLGIDNNILGRDFPGRQQGRQGQDRHGGITARAGDQPGIGQFVPRGFGQAIHGLGLQMGRVMLMAIIFGIGVDAVQAEIGG